MLEWLRQEIAKLLGRLEALEEAGKVREELVAIVNLLLELAERLANEIEARREQTAELERQLIDLRQQLAEVEEEVEEEPAAEPAQPVQLPPVPPPAPVTPEPEQPKRRGLLAGLF